jgi:hypothetical protein
LFRGKNSGPEAKFLALEIFSSGWFQAFL